MAFFFNKASMETIEEFCLLKAQTYIVICVYAKKKTTKNQGSSSKLTLHGNHATKAFTSSFPNHY